MSQLDEFDYAFDPSALAILQEAFDAAWRELVAARNLSEGDVVSAARQTLASRIIEVANSGVRDRHALKTEALRALV